MGLRGAKKERTRSEILETAEALFRRDGYEAASIRAIAAAVPVSVQTLYNYFPSKGGILAAIAADRFAAMAGAAEQMRVRFLESADQDGDPVERFLHLVRWGLRGLDSDREFMRLVFLHARGVVFGQRTGTASNPGLEGDAVNELRARQDENNDVLFRMFAGMQKSGALRDDVDPAEMASLYVLIFSDRVTRWFEQPNGSLDELEASVIGGLEIVMRGLRPVRAGPSAPR